MKIRDAARNALGFDSLRPGQGEALEAVLRGRDTLVVMLTGGGKSAVYHIATGVSSRPRSPNPLLLPKTAAFLSRGIPGCSTASGDLE